MGEAALDLAIRFIEERETAPATDTEGAYELAASLRRSPPEQGEDLGTLLGTIRLAASKAFDTAGPGYLAYIPGGGLYASAIGDFLACVTNRFVNISAPAPALVQLEANVVRWLCDTFALPGASQGILTSGGSIANFSAVVTARHTKLGEDLTGARLYISEHVHHSVSKAARLAGIPSNAVVPVACDQRLRMDPTALDEAIERDLSAGLRPFLAVGSAGTVSTGAVDPLSEIARVCRERELWFHVDGAYGGFFRLTEQGRITLAGIEEADSITLDPHKGMFLPYGTGSLLVRDGAALKDAHRESAGYLPETSDDDALPDFADHSAELSRDFRGLRLWLPLHLHGVQMFRNALTEKLDLARTVYDELAADERLEVPWEPQLSLVAFRPREGGDEAAGRLLDEVNASKRIFLSSTSIGGRKYLRVCILSHRTRPDRIEEAIEIIKKATTRL